MIEKDGKKYIETKTGLIEVPDFISAPEMEKMFNKKNYFILDENNNAIPANVLEWGEFLEKEHSRKIVKQENVGEYWVSTVFLGLDHNFCGMFDVDDEYIPHRLHIFETMVFKDDYNEDYCARCATWQEAEIQHEIAVKWVKDGAKYEEDKEDEYDEDSKKKDQIQ